MNTPDDVSSAYLAGKEEGKAEALKEVLEIINKTKLPTDKDYRYSNEYIEEWIEELKLNLQEAKR
jgi:predicted RNA-binding protein with EMAP domain